MQKRRLLSAAILASSFLGFSAFAPASAEDYTPTLDKVKATSSAYLSNPHEKYTLSPSQGTNTNSVIINGTTYYYTPDEETPAKNSALINLVSTGSAALTLGDSSDYVFKVDEETYYTYDTAKLPTSVYTVSPGTDSNYTWTNGTEYYLAALNTTKMASSGKISWEKSGTEVVPTDWDGETATGTVEVKIPHNGGTLSEYYTYTYEKPGVYTVTDERLDNITTDNTNKKVFTVGSDVNGGAIYNTTDKSGVNILSDFIKTHASSSSNIYGGAIYNNGSIAKIGNITGNFIGNYASSTNMYAYGGAIDNYYGTIGDIKGDFIENYASSTSTTRYAAGGAIYNDGGTTGNITGDFIGNYAISTGFDAYGGAIMNDGYSVNSHIGDITGNFVGNYVSSAYYVYGGAIYSFNSTIGDITGDFIGNYATSSGDYGVGGAIFNDEATIGNITGDFIGNYVSSTGNDVYGGAVYNNHNSTIGDITGNFIGNYATSVSNVVRGGAIGNEGTIGDISGNFIGNYASSTSGTAHGGAIYNESGTIGNIKDSNFTDNYATTQGGAIWNSGTITSISADFTNNTASGSDEENFMGGGAIYNLGTIGDDEHPDVTAISGTFLGNKETGEYGTGGAIYNNGTITKIANATFGGTGEGEDNSACIGGAIFNDSEATIKSISANFIGNTASGSNVSGTLGGGAIYNLGTIGDDEHADVTAISGTFQGNKATGEVGIGGAIWNGGTITTISDATFGGTEEGQGNTAMGGGAIANYGANINNIVDSKFIGNSGAYAGGAIVNIFGTINLIADSDFTGNSAAGLGGAIWNEEGSTINSISANFTGNKATGENGAGGAIYNHGAIGNITGNFIDNYTESIEQKARGGAIYNEGTINSISDSTFINNTSTSENGTAYAGAIWNDGEITFSGTNTFSGNTANGAPNDIYNTGTLYFDGTMNLEGGIDGDPENIASNKVDITNGTTTIGYALKNQTVIVDGGELHLQGYNGTKTDVSGSAISVNGGATINTIDDAVNPYSNITVNDSASVKLDVSLAESGSADTFIIEDGGEVSLTGIQIITDNESGATVSIAGNNKGNIDTASLGTIYTTLYKYTVAGNIDPNDGKIVITKVAASGGLAGAITAGANEYSLTANDTTITENITTGDDLTVYGQGKESYSVNIGGNTFTTGGETPTTTTFKDTKITGTSAGAIVNAAGNTMIMKDSVVGVQLINHGTLDSDPTDYTVRVDNDGDATFSGDTFKNISSTDVNGGALYNASTGTVVIQKDASDNKVLFEHNSTNQYGGAIYNEGTMTISDAVFGSATDDTQGNSAIFGGGAIFNNNGATITSISADFYDNSSPVDGGAILNHGIIGDLDHPDAVAITGIFEGNSSGDVDGGGAIANFGTMTTISNATFGNSLDNTRGNHTDAFGGAIYSEGTIGKIVNSNFYYNSAGRGAGAINNGEDLTIIDSNFTGNTAGSVGGAIESHNSNLTINAVNSNVSFTDNTANGAPNDIYMFTQDAESPITLYLNAATGRSITLSGGVDGGDNDDGDAGAYNIVVNSGSGNDGDVTIASITSEEDTTVGVTLNAGTLNITNASTVDSLSVQGDSTINAGGTTGLTFGTLTLADDITLTNSGKLTTAGNVDVSNITYDGTGTLIMTGGTITPGDPDVINAVTLAGDVSTGTTRIEGVVDVTDATVGAMQIIADKGVIATTSNITGAVQNDGTVMLTNTSNGNLGAYSKLSAGGGVILLTEVSGNPVYTTTAAITDQAIKVEAGNTLHIANAAHLGSGSQAKIRANAIISTIDNAVNDYTASQVELVNNSGVMVDFSDTAIDTFVATLGEGDTIITLEGANYTGAMGEASGSFQMLNDGATVKGTQLISTGSGTIVLSGSGENDGMVNFSTTEKTGLNGAVEISATGDLTYKVNAASGEDVNQGAGETSIGHIQDKFVLKSDTPSTKAEVRAKNGTYGIIVDSGKQLDVTDITFTNFANNPTDSAATNYEGTITNYGTLNIVNSIFNAPTTADKIAIANYGTLKSDPTTYKGGIANYHGASATIEGDTFQNINRTGYNGGAIYNEAAEGGDPAGQVTLKKDALGNKVTFLNNKAAEGGAIYNSGTATITDAIFGSATDDTQGNSATGNGGAIANYGTITSISADFYDNSADDGGAIFNNGTIGDTSDPDAVAITGIFEGNTAVGDNGGGAIVNSGTITTISGATFGNSLDNTRGNHSDSTGGAINNYGDIGKIVNSNFYYNTAGSDGGAIEQGGGTDLTITDSNFIGNTSGGVGGAIDNCDADLTINAVGSNVSFTDNKQKYVSSTDYKANDIYMYTYDADSPITLALNAATGKSITLSGGVDGGDNGGSFAGAYNIVVNTGEGNTGAVIINSITSESDTTVGLTLNAGSLTVSNDSTINSFTANGGTFSTGSGKKLTTSALTIGNGKILTNSGSLFVTDTLTNGTNGETTYGTITNNGTLTLGGTDNAVIDNVGMIGGTGNLIIGDAVHAVTVTNSGTKSKINGNDVEIKNKGTLIISADDITDKNNSIVNAGTLNLTGASGDGLDFNNSVTGAGKTVITTDRVNLLSGRTIAQAIDIIADASHAAMLVANADNIGGNVAINAGSGENHATLRLTGGTLNYNVDGYTIPETTTKTYGILEVTGSTILASGKTVDVDDLTISGSSTVFTNNNSVTVRDDLTNSGTITNNATTATLNLIGGTSSDPTTNAGTINGTGKTVIGNGTNTAYTTNTGTIATAVTVKNAATFENTTGTVSGATTVNTGGTAKQSGTGSMGAVTNDGTLLISAGSVASVTNNATGTQGVTQTGGSVTGTVTNNGKYNMQGGSVSVFKQETSTADLNISNSATMTLGAGSVISAGKVTIDGTSKLNVTGTSDSSRAVVTLDGGAGLTNVVWDGEVQVNGGHLILANIIDQTRVTGTDPYNKTGKLTATTGELTIYATNVLLGNQDTIADAVKVNLDTENLYVGKSGSESASVYLGTDDTWHGVINLANSGTVTLDGTTTAVDTVTPANSNSLNAQSGTLNLVNTGIGTGKHGSATGVTFGNSADKVMYDVATTVTADKLNINAGQVQFNGSGTGVDDLSAAGTITLAGGQLDLDGIKTGGTSGTTARLVANTGKLNIQATQGTNHVTELAYLSGDNGDTIAKAVETTIASGATLKINSGKANVTLDSATGSADDWSGNVELAAGSLTLDTITKATTSSPVSTYVQTGGTLTMLDSSLSLNDTTSKITNGKVAMTSTSATTPYSAGSQLTFDNGTAAANANAAVITSDANTNNSITVGGTNGAKLTLKASSTPAENSDINANTAVTITGNGTLTAYGYSIKGGGTATTITNDGTFNLSNNGSTAGTIARAINKSTSTITTGTVNLTGTTLSTANGTINQANLNVGDGSGAVDSSTFTMGANVTLSDTLKVFTDGKIVNATKDIVTDKITVQSTGSIVGSSGTGASEGNFTVNNGGSNAGTISQSIVSLTGGTLDNTGTLTANGLFTSAAVITDTATSGTLNINKGGSSTAAITQKVIAFNPTTASTTFTNSADMTATTSLTNGANSIIDNTSGADINVQNATPLTTPALLTNNGTINSETGDINADNVANTGTIGLKKSDLVISYQSGDLAGTLKVIGDAKTDKSQVTVKDTTTGSLVARDITGTVDIQSGTMELIAGNIVDGTTTNIAAGSKLNVKAAARSDASVFISSGDTFAGDLVLDEGKVTIKDIVASTSSTETTSTSTNPYYAQNGGELNLVNATLSMEKADLINAATGKMNIDKDSHFESLSGAFKVKDLQNAGTVHSINGGYENHLFDNHIVGDGAGDSKAEYTTDFYARSNSDKKYDQFGSDGAVIKAADTTTHTGTVHIADWQLNGDIMGKDAPIDRSIKFDHLFKGSVLAGDTINFTSTNKEVETPIGWYALNSKGGGDYALDLVRFNDKVFRGQVSTLAQYQNQLAIDDMMFNHTMIDQGFKGNDSITGNPNQYASANDVFAPYQYSRKDGGLWVKMYGNFEKIHAGGMDIGNNAYGTIIGADFGLKDLKRGWQFMPTAYVGYNGAHQYWNGNGAYQNGAQLGFMGTFYKNDFMIGTLAYGGFYGNEMSTPKGNDQAFNYFAGGAVKTAYNWKFKKNWALQPNFMVAYSFFGQENWHTDFGQMGMMSGMLHGINIAPGLNLIYERETWSTYLTVQYMYNVNQAVGGRAGNIDLPRLSMDRGYLQYGIGINKKFTDRFSGYFQTVIRNVGRNGVGLQMGFQWRLGKGGNKATTQKGNVTPELKKTEIVLNGKSFNK